MKYLTGISQGFGKDKKAEQLCRTPPNDCFFLKTWSQYHFKKNRRKLKIVLIWRSSRKMNRNKKLLILYYSWQRLSEFSNSYKKSKVFHAFSFQLCSTSNSKFPFYVPFLFISAEILCVLFHLIYITLFNLLYLTSWKL